jgi:nucleoid-associated protein YgaU
MFSPTNNFKILNLFAVLLGAFLMSLQGCSFFSVRPENPEAGASSSNSAEFDKTKTRVSAVANPVPIPIEVASDISQIMQGKAPNSVPTVFTKEVPEGESPAEEEDVAEVEIESSPPLKVSENVKPSSRGPAKTNGQNQSYQVRVGDTLMKISFEKYGNVYRWRQIYEQNKNLIANYNVLVPGTVLTIYGVEYVLIEKNGKPYLIRKNDTLVKISNSLYGNSKEWKSLWQNNRQLIHNPNKIYAGFTLYYKPTEGLAENRQSGQVKARLQSKKMRQPISDAAVAGLKDPLNPSAGKALSRLPAQSNPKK